MENMADPVENIHDVAVPQEKIMALSDVTRVGPLYV
jgi:hypothetical protein